MSCGAISAHSSACCARMASWSVVIDDVIANPASIYDEQTYHSNRTKLKLSSQVGFRSQDTTKMRPKGNWLGLPLSVCHGDDGRRLGLA